MYSERDPLMFCVVENVRKKHLNWIEFILDQKRWSRRRLTIEAGISPSTLTKFFNDTSNTQLLNSYSIEKIERASGIPAFETSIISMPRGVIDHESDDYEVTSVSSLSSAVRSFMGNSDYYEPLILRARSLELAGYLPGDVLIVDPTAKPMPGDIVCGQIITRRGQSDRIIRIYDDPFLYAASADQRLIKPLLVDGHNVKIGGVVVASFRERRAA